MSLALWTFWTYSFFGYLLERGYAAAAHGAQQARKGFLLLPMCPVYGLGALAVLALPAALTDGFWRSARLFRRRSPMPRCWCSPPTR